MEGLLARFVFIFCFLGLSATAYGQTPVPCVSKADLQKISTNFTQFKQFLSTNKTQYCEAELGKEWIRIANSMVSLMNIKLNEPKLNAADALTFKAISEKDWWSYFIKRADRFVIQVECPENVVAFVQPINKGAVNLCAPFFRDTSSGQASTLMHEVRHFDGFSHVTCTQGNENGTSGACDTAITLKGSYAVSVQTSVALARAASTEKAEIPGLEAEAVYSAFNKFNTVPKVKLKSSIILANNLGEVSSWVVGQSVKLIKKLSEPAVVLNSANNLTIYPLNTQSDAYRKDKTLNVAIDNPGLFAVRYNSESPAERAKYKNIMYLGTGGLLKGNSIFALCDNSELPELIETNLSSLGNISAVISRSKDANDQVKESLILTENGDLHSYECEKSPLKSLKITKSPLKLAKSQAQVVESFGFNGKQYALLANGSLSVLSQASNTLTLSAVQLPIANKGLVSATPFSQAEIFN